MASGNAPAAPPGRSTSSTWRAVRRSTAFSNALPTVFAGAWTTERGTPSSASNMRRRKTRASTGWILPGCPGRGRAHAGRAAPLACRASSGGGGPLDALRHPDRPAHDHRAVPFPHRNRHRPLCCCHCCNVWTNSLPCALCRNAASASTTCWSYLKGRSRKMARAAGSS